MLRRLLAWRRGRDTADTDSSALKPAIETMAGTSTAPVVSGVEGPESPPPRRYVEGELVEYRREMRLELVASGAVISPSAMISKSGVTLRHPVVLSPHCVLSNPSSVGKFSFINWYTVVFPNVEIGAYCAIGRNVQIGLAMHPTQWLSSHPFQYSKGYFPEFPAYEEVVRKRHLMHRPTKIGNDVWIGSQASISSGVTIGDGAVIGAGAVVTKDVEPYAIVGGVPARLIRRRFADEVVEKLLELRWWDLELRQISDLEFDDIEACVARLEDIRGRERA